MFLFIKPTFQYWRNIQEILNQLSFKHGLLGFVDITATNNTNSIQDYLQHLTGVGLVPWVFIGNQRLHKQTQWPNLPATEWEADDVAEADWSSAVMKRVAVNSMLTAVIQACWRPAHLRVDVRHGGGQYLLVTWIFKKLAFILFLSD